MRWTSDRPAAYSSSGLASARRANSDLTSCPPRRSSDLFSVAAGVPPAVELGILPGGSVLRARPSIPQERSAGQDAQLRLEEHTSELQSPVQVVCRLLPANKTPNAPDHDRERTPTRPAEH